MAHDERAESFFRWQDRQDYLQSILDEVHFEPPKHTPPVNPDDPPIPERTP